MRLVRPDWVTASPTSPEDILRENQNSNIWEPPSDWAGKDTVVINCSTSAKMYNLTLFDVLKIDDASGDVNDKSGEKEEGEAGDGPDQAVVR